MIRRDYILRMIEEFFQALTRIRNLKRDQRLAEADAELDQEFARLINPAQKKSANCPKLNCWRA